MGVPMGYDDEDDEEDTSSACQPKINYFGSVAPQQHLPPQHLPPLNISTVKLPFSESASGACSSSGGTRYIGYMMSGQAKPHKTASPARELLRSGSFGTPPQVSIDEASRPPSKGRPPSRGANDGKQTDVDGNPFFWDGRGPSRRFTMGDERVATAAMAALDDGPVYDDISSRMRCTSAPDLHKQRSLGHGDLTPSESAGEGTLATPAILPSVQRPWGFGGFPGEPTSKISATHPEFAVSKLLPFPYSGSKLGPTISTMQKSSSGPLLVAHVHSHHHHHIHLFSTSANAGF